MTCSQCLMKIGQEYNRQLTAEEIEAVMKTHAFLSIDNNKIIDIDQETLEWIKYSAYTKNESFEIAVNRLLGEYYNISLEKYHNQIEEALGLK